MPLAFERLEVYRCATEHLVLAVRITQGSVRPPGFLSERYRGAALAIPLNIAEGAGRAGAEEQRRFYAVARQSAMECGVILDAVAQLGVADEPAVNTGKELLERIVRVLSLMCLPRPRKRRDAQSPGVL